MIVRMGLLRRKKGLPVDAFRSHWRDVHGPLAARLPGLLRYHQNHVVSSPEPISHMGAIDGISELWFEDAQAMAGVLGVRYDEIPIEGPLGALSEALAPQIGHLPPDATEENLQARVRGMLLMALSNKTGSIVLTTGNKSELAVGYATLYGDMAGGFNVLKDVKKTLVVRLARYRNLLGRVIPERVLTRPPSAELRADQTDEQSLPPYPVLDAILEQYVEQDRSPAEIVADGHAEADVREVVALVHRAEYKRRQAAVGIRITPRGFGKDWRYPITSGWAEAFV